MKLLSLFSGIGAFEKALERLGITYTLVNYCEVDKYASKAYSLIHNVPESLNLWDITKVNENELPGVDLVTYGFPCVPAGTKIKVQCGYKDIEDVIVGDYVLTHTNNYQKVLRTMSRVSDSIRHIKGVGAYNLYLTDEHPLYIYRDGEFIWVKAKDLKPTDYITYNINAESTYTDLDDDRLWLFGRYFADGYCEKLNRKRPIFCIGSHKKNEFEKHLTNIKHNLVHGERTCVEFRIMDDKLDSIIHSCGSGASIKKIPDWVVSLNKEQLSKFFEGYMSGDGHRRKDRATSMFSTINEQMFLQLCRIVIKLYNVVPTTSIRKDRRKDSFKNCYNAQFSDRTLHQLVIGDKIAVPIKAIEIIEKPIEVFNLEVENDNSYTVNNIIVHNCQDISVSGKKMGLEYNGEKTRSGLVFDALRIIKATNPKYAVCENVKNLTGKKFTKEFNYILDCLNEMGYNNYWKVLNAADYGIPQRRERVFIISIRKDIDKGFNFPAPFPLTKSLKDVLENEVEDRYFMRDDKVKDYIKHFKSVTPYGTEKDGTCRTIKANYYKTSQANFLQNDDRIATGVVVPQLTELTSGMPQAKRVYDVNGLSVTLKGEAGGLGAKTGLYKIENRIRKLTPKECFRLMGFEDRDIEVCKGISNTQFYKMAGNSIVVDVLYYIFKELFKNENR